METPQVKLTKKGLPDKRVQSAPKNMKKALEVRKQIFNEHKERKNYGLNASVQIPNDKSDSDSSDSSYDSDDSNEIIIQTSKKSESKKPKEVASVPNPVSAPVKTVQDKKLEDIESMIRLMAQGQGIEKKQKEKKKKTIIQIEQAAPPPPQAVPDKPYQDKQLDQHMLRKILNF